MARIRTTGIVQTELEQRIVSNHDDEPESLKFLVVDVGGQRNERKKWIHCFDDVSAIMFVVNLAGYNQVLFEDTRKNRMHESLELFEKTANNAVFAECPIFLFLNKKDIFETMVQTADMKSAFPEYEGGTVMMSALNFIQEQFAVRLPPKKEHQEVQIVSARVRREIKCGFENVKDTLYNKNRSQMLSKVAKLKSNYRAIEQANNKRCWCC